MALNTQCHYHELVPLCWLLSCQTHANFFNHLHLRLKQSPFRTLYFRQLIKFRCCLELIWGLFTQQNLSLYLIIKSKKPLARQLTKLVKVLHQLIVLLMNGRVRLGCKCWKKSFANFSCYDGFLSCV